MVSGSLSCQRVTSSAAAATTSDAHALSSRSQFLDIKQTCEQDCECSDSGALNLFFMLVRRRLTALFESKTETARVWNLSCLLLYQKQRKTILISVAVSGKINLSYSSADHKCDYSPA